MLRLRKLPLLVAISMLALAACSQEEAVVVENEPPATGEPEAPPATGEADEPATSGDGDRTTEGMERLREGAGAILEGGRILGEEAREQARQALEDAGPALDRAGEIFGEIGQSMNEIAGQAVRDLKTAAGLLEQRIAEATGEPEPFTGDPAAILAPADELNADTRAAARAGPAGVGPDYVGVWAASPEACARIDVEAVELFAVITPTTIRRYESVCNFEPGEMTEEGVMLDASCVAEGSMEERSITLGMADPDTLVIGAPDSPVTTELTRCHLPEE